MTAATGPGWTPPPVKVDLYSMWGSSANDVFAVGIDWYENQSTILHYGPATPPEHTLNATVDPAGSGTVELDPAGPTYPSGTTVTLTANPAAGYAFDHWSGDLSGSDNPATIVMDADKNVTAHFVLPADLTVTGIAVPEKPDKIVAGSPVAVTAVILNNGPGEAKTFTAALYASKLSKVKGKEEAGPEGQVGTVTVDCLAAGAGTAVEFTWTPAEAGKYLLRAAADVGNVVIETDENNNELTGEVRVKKH